VPTGSPRGTEATFKHKSDAQRAIDEAEQGRTVGGVLTILRSLSAMAEDAITDDLAEINPFKGIKLGGNECSRSFEQVKRVIG